MESVYIMCMLCAVQSGHGLLWPVSCLSPFIVAHHTNTHTQSSDEAQSLMRCHTNKKNDNTCTQYSKRFLQVLFECELHSTM